MYNCFVKNFFEWFDEQFDAWSKLHGGKSENQFSAYLGISQPTVNSWRLRTRGVPKTKAIIDKLAEKLNYEVYDVLGLERPPEPIPFDSLPSDIRERFAAASREIKERSAKLYNAGPDSPEVKALAAEVFAAHGFNITSIK